MYVCTVFALCIVPVCMHLCSHIACFMYACIGVRTMYACIFHVCMHLCSHIACFVYACIGVRTLHTIWERTHHTHTKVLKAVWERTHQTTIEHDMDTVLIVCFIGLFVCLFSFCLETTLNHCLTNTHNVLRSICRVHPKTHNVLCLHHSLRNDIFDKLYSDGRDQVRLHGLR